MEDQLTRFTNVMLKRPRMPTRNETIPAHHKRSQGRMGGRGGILPELRKGSVHMDDRQPVRHIHRTSVRQPWH